MLIIESTKFIIPDIVDFDGVMFFMGFENKLSKEYFLIKHPYLRKGKVNHVNNRK